MTTPSSSPPTHAPHDALFRRIFSDPFIAAEALRGALPAEVAAAIDLGSLVLQPGSFVDEDLRATHSDLVFAAKIAGRDAELRGARVFVLLEHQSSPDALMPFRLLRYAVRVWDHFIVENPRATKLPVMIPIVLHQGPGPWRAPVDMLQVLDLTEVERAILGRYAPQWRFELDDLGTTTDESLRTRLLRPDVTFALAALRDVRSEVDVMSLVARWGDVVRGASQTSAGLRALVTTLRYILEVHTGLDVQRLAELVDSIVQGAGEPIMATAQQLIQEGLEKGLEKGREEGLLLGRRAALRNQVRLKFGTVAEHAISRVEAADAATLDRWEGQILTATTLDDALA